MEFLTEKKVIPNSPLHLSKEHRKESKLYKYFIAVPLMNPESSIPEIPEVLQSSNHIMLPRALPELTPWLFIPFHFPP